MYLALDPSLNKTGYAIYSEAGLIDSGVIRTPQQGSVLEKQTALKAKLRHILGSKERAIKQAIVEIPASIPYTRTQGRGGKLINLDALLKLSRAVGVLTQTLTDWGVSVYEVTPQRWKGNRVKGWDQLAAAQMLGRKVTDDEADAIALGVYFGRIKRDEQWQKK